MKTGAALGTAALAACALAVAWQAPLAVHAQSVASPTYTPAQATAGRAAYAQSCASCHGANLDDGEFAPPVKGASFQQQWGGKPVDDLFEYATTKMPPGAPGSLGDERYADVLAFLLQQNGVAPGTRALPTDAPALRAMVTPGAPPGPGGGLSAGVALPPAPPRPSAFAHWTAVTDAMLANPPQTEWLTWRRTYDAHGFSPLKQITTTNVSQLRPAWVWSLPNGPSEATPLVHDGVIFVHGYGDKVQALDVVTGDLLWQYSRRLPRGTAPSWQRTMALYGGRLYVPTSDTHVVALDVKSGAVVWDHAVADKAKGYGMSGGPLIARGTVMVGTTGRAPGGNLIVGLDANTGAEKWTFHVIAQPGTPGGDTWNNLPVEKRNGASVWVAGSYDPALNLAFFGIAQTYDTGPLRNLAPGATSNAGLYTDSTLAINPDTGKLAWHFQHQPNDQWDLDWAFERQLISLPGSPKTVVLTGGKQMIFDALEADGGKYLFSFDLGLQNLVTSIDPKTGAKTVDQRLIPGDGQTKMVCPHAGGGRSWLPTSYNAATHVLIIPIVESCMDLTPVAPGERGGLSTGVRFSLRPRPDSDGKYGRLEAIDVVTRKPVWIDRQRAPQTTGVLSTAGGVVFAGAYDRWFTAYDAATGRALWRTRLNDVPNAPPITFMVNGHQYVAQTVGNGGPQPATFPNLTPEIVNPPDRGAALWVFAVPDQGASATKGTR
jgi:alcohol dehydrogenase (cytochrome c)